MASLKNNTEHKHSVYKARKSTTKLGLRSTATFRNNCSWKYIK